jgi:hypothetical protein
VDDRLKPGRRAWALGLLLLCATGCARPPRAAAAEPPASPRVALFLSADVRGQLGPCGCSEAMRGGLPRAASLVEAARREGAAVALLDGGDLLFASAALTEAQRPGEERKARALADGFKRMGLVAAARGERDLARGAAFADGLGLPWLEAGGTRLLELGGRKLGVVAGREAGHLRDGAAALRASGAQFVVALAHVDWAAAQRLAAEPGLGSDLLLVGHGGEGLAAEENRVLRGAVPVLQLQDRGRSLARVDLRFAAGGGFEWAAGEADRDRELAALDARVELLRGQLDAPGLSEELKRLRAAKLEELLSRRAGMAQRPVELPAGRNLATLRLLPVEHTVAEEPGVAAVVAAYDADVGALNLAWAKANGTPCPEPAPGQGAFVGSTLCGGCHAEALATWERSKHAQAYAALKAKGKALHLECVGCHVTGWVKPGGTCRLDGLQGAAQAVGCEACHGPGSLHVSAPSRATIQREVPESTCTGCHDRENSPHFQWSAYLPLILGPGHGAR